jgi:hypothetical protein
MLGAPANRVCESRGHLTPEDSAMIIVRHCFIAKPGQASKLAAVIKEAVAQSKLVNPRVLTDVTGDFNRVVLEHEADGLAGFESAMNDYATNKKFQDKMKGYTDLYVTGSREILRLA